jgi:nucleoside-diphosphate-sugar epimerase
MWPEFNNKQIEMKNKKVLIAGATGYIGNHVAQILAAT